jgi:hypothetical protein
VVSRIVIEMKSWIPWIPAQDKAATGSLLDRFRRPLRMREKAEHPGYLNDDLR